MFHKMHSNRSLQTYATSDEASSKMFRLGISKIVKRFLYIILIFIVYLLVTTPDEQSDNLVWEIEEKLRNIQTNVEHRWDFLESSWKQPGFPIKTPSLTSRKISMRVEVEKLLAFNPYKKQGLNDFSSEIRAKLDYLQNHVCRLDKVLICSLERSNCGFACQMHQLAICFIIAYQMDRSMVLARPEVNGMQNMSSHIFMPISSSCPFNNLDREQIIKETVRPMIINHQQKNGKRSYDGFKELVKKASNFHSEPIGFVVSQLVAFAMRFNKTSNFYRNLQHSKIGFNIEANRPYVGIQIRRSDKWDEAQFHDLDHYMDQVEQFYEYYFKKNPTHSTSAQRVVYVASDDMNIIPSLKKNYPSYRFIYNDSYTYLTGSREARYSTAGFESLLFDLYFLSNADYLVCTFSSNICRLAYELKLAHSDDLAKFHHSLDTPYYLVSEARFYKMAVLSSRPDSGLLVRKGDLFYRRCISGLDCREYQSNGFYFGKNIRTNIRQNYPSYMLKSVYF